MAEPFDCFAIIEVMGKQRYAGRVSEQVIGGQAFVRVDIPDVPGQPAFTKLFGGGSIFCITPVTEDVAKTVAARHTNPPVQPWELAETVERRHRPALPNIDPEEFDED